MKLIILILILSASVSQASITKEQLNGLFEVFHQIYDPILRPNEVIIFNQPTGVPDYEWWDFNDFKATYSGLFFEDRQVFHHNIFFFGGIARTDFITLDGAAMILCHEMGHGFGGAPFKQSGPSVEGQADYYSTNTCLRQYFKLIPREPGLDEYSPKKVELCTENLGLFTDLSECIRGLTAIESRVVAFNFFKNAGTSIFSHDPSCVKTVDTDDYYYPKHQCRVDTLMSGWFHKKRPVCWFPHH